MKKVKPSKGEWEEDELKEALAVLISCTHSKRRPLPLTEVSQWLTIAVGKLGSYSAVAERIGLSSKMLRQFAYVRRLSRPVQKLFEVRKLDSVDAAAHLAMLPEQDQQVIAKALVSGEIDTSDIRAVTQLRQSTGRSIPINSLLKRVKESKAKKEYVAEFVVRGFCDHRRIAKAFRKFLPASDIIRVEVSGSLGRLVLTQNGKTALAKTASVLGVPLKRLIPAILQGPCRL
jgi:hypothetical protein